MVPCDQAGVLLTLTEDAMFALEVTNRCGTGRSTLPLEGSWESSGSGELRLLLDEEGGAAVVPCVFSADDRLSCSLGDTGFTLSPVRR